MPTIVACKLPHGLVINHQGETIQLVGANGDWDPARDPANPPANGFAPDTAVRSYGYGLTTLTDAQAAALDDWSNHALYRTDENGKATKEAGLHPEPFLPLTNGAIMVFKSEAEARREVAKANTNVVTGFEGLDGDAEIKKASEEAGLVPEEGVSEKSPQKA